MNVKRLQEEISTIANFTSNPDGIYRLAYSEAERDALIYLKEQFEIQGMKTRFDAVGNLIARLEGTSKNLPAVAMGSHIDSVYDAGAYDGVAGVLSALEVVRSLNEQRIKTRHPIEIIVFTCEESSRFGMSTIGSKAMAGVLDIEKARMLVDRDGKTFENVLESNQFNIQQVKSAEREPTEFKSFIEIHIEQGPVLETQRLDIGIVHAIAAPVRFQVEFEGCASHSGTTPMGYRKDALLGASELALGLEKFANEEKEHGTVATVGVLTVEPGGMNIVPGATKVSVDIRGIHSNSRKCVVKKMRDLIQNIEETRGLVANIQPISEEEPVQLDQEIISHIQKISERLGLKHLEMPSGAGHDAMNMAHLCPTGLIFIPSKNGLSHNPAEFTSIEYIEKVTSVLFQFVIETAIVNQVDHMSN